MGYQYYNIDHRKFESVFDQINKSIKFLKAKLNKMENFHDYEDIKL